MAFGLGLANIAGSVASSFMPFLYTGNSSTQSITGIGFLPDLVWLKRQDASDAHGLFDSLRGATEMISSATSGAEFTNANALTSFDADGFSLGNNTAFNNNTSPNIAWCFKEESEIFKIASFTGTGAAHTETHTLGVLPELMFFKNLISGFNWKVYHKDLNGGTTPEDFELELNTVNGESNVATTWNDTAPTSSVFTVGTGVEVNENTSNIIAYLFASKPGVSKVGSYSGTGISGNAITGLGFVPRFVLIKRIDGTGDWRILDTARGDNVALSANTTAAEVALNSTLDTDGFTLDTVDTDVNASGTNNYIYFARA